MESPATAAQRHPQKSPAQSASVFTDTAVSAQSLAILQQSVAAAKDIQPEDPQQLADLANQAFCAAVSCLQQHSRPEAEAFLHLALRACPVSSTKAVDSIKALLKRVQDTHSGSEPVATEAESGAAPSRGSPEVQQLGASDDKCPGKEPGTQSARKADALFRSAVELIKK